MSPVQKSRRLALFAIALPLVGARAAIVALEPRKRLSDLLPPINLERDLPLRFADWQNDERSQMQVVSPTLSSALADAYDQTVSRVYQSDAGDAVMLSAAYGMNQRERKLHMPAGCYNAQGFSLTAFGSTSFDVGGRRLAASTFVANGPGSVREYVAYWVVYGQMLASARLQGRYELFLQEAKGLIPDGLLMRVSVALRGGQPVQEGERALQAYVPAIHAAMTATAAGRYFPPSATQA